MGTLKKTARLWCFQSPGRSRTEAEHHTKQFLRQLPTRKPAGVIPTAQQTHPLHWLVLATALLCFPCTQVRRFPLRAGKQALGEEKAGEKKKSKSFPASKQSPAQTGGAAGFVQHTAALFLPASFCWRGEDFNCFAISPLTFELAMAGELARPPGHTRSRAARAHGRVVYATDLSTEKQS